METTEFVGKKINEVLAPLPICSPAKSLLKAAAPADETCARRSNYHNYLWQTCHSAKKLMSCG
jgi:hypothetical protein